jgi:DNA-binding NtrC family response regulator
MPKQTSHQAVPSSPGPNGALRVLVFERDAHACAAMLRTIRGSGLECARTPSGADLVDRLRDGVPTVVVADLAGDDRLFDDLRAGIVSVHTDTVLVALSSTISANRAVRWMRSGADDVLIKPIDPLELRAAVTRAADRLMLRLRSRRPLATGESDALASIVGDDPRLQRALYLARAASRVRSTALLQGETGTGKSMLARAIHAASPRAAGPFIEVACGSIPEALLESELFGHVKGAFTGAIADKKGRFLAAHGGTIFLDELNAATSPMQVKLLRVLQQRSFEPVGSDDTIQVDVRVIVASNQPLERMVEEGRFSPDLFYRVHVLSIDLPPLRDRTTDLERLASHFLALKAAEVDRTILGFSREAMETMRAYTWPGNVRELENSVERATVMCEGAWIEPEHLPERVLARVRAAAERGHDRGHDRGHEHTHLRSPPITISHTPASFPIDPQLGSTQSHADSLNTMPDHPPSTHATSSRAAETARHLSEQLRDPERAALITALEQHGWNRSKTAKALGIDRTTLYRKMRDLGLGRYGQAG